MSKWRAGGGKEWSSCFYGFSREEIWLAACGGCHTTTLCASLKHTLPASADGNRGNTAPLWFTFLLACRQRSSSQTLKSRFCWFVLVASVFRFILFLSPLIFSCIFNLKKKGREEKKGLRFSDITDRFYPTVYLLGLTVSFYGILEPGQEIVPEAAAGRHFFFGRLSLHIHPVYLKSVWWIRALYMLVKFFPSKKRKQCFETDKSC